MKNAKRSTIVKEEIRMKNAKRSTIVVSFIIIGISAILLSNALAQRSSRPRRGGMSGSELEKPPVPKDDNEKKILSILDDIRATQSYRNVPPQDGRFLRITAQAMNAKNVVEIGTSTGYSGIWFGMALQKTGGVDDIRNRCTTCRYRPRQFQTSGHG
ncbi:MAG: hypothetical protein ACYS30_09365 [Planctomycetota bacterium]